METLIGGGRPSNGSSSGSSSGSTSGSTLGGPGAALPVKDVNTADFMAEVIDASFEQPVVVDFWAPWCGPCKTLGPQLEKAVAEAKGAVRMVKVNIDNNQDLAAQMRIQSIPAVYAFKDGRPVDGFVGAVPESQIKAFVKKLGGAAGPSAIEEAITVARQALAEGDINTAGNFFAQILQREPQNVAALVGLARCHLLAGGVDEAREILASIPAEAANDPEVAGLRTALELAEEAAKAGAPGELEARLAADPKDHEARFGLALGHYAAGDMEGAIDHLLEIVKLNRTWNEEAARKQLVKIFEALGPTDPLTVASRRRLSAILFS